MMKDIEKELEELPELRSRLKHGGQDLTLVINLSGGADSIASLLYCIEQFPMARKIAVHQAIWMDWRSTFPYIRKVTEQFNIPLVIVQAIYTEKIRVFKNGRPAETQLSMELVMIDDERALPYSRGEAAALIGSAPEKTVAGVIDLAEYRGMPPTAGKRWCTSYFKSSAFNAWVRRNRQELGSCAVNVLGFRWAESAGRSKQPVGKLRTSVSLKDGWECWDFHPIIKWSKNDAFETLRRFGVEPHIAYRAQGMDLKGEIPEGGARCSCVGCIFSHHKHIAEAVTPMEGVPTEETLHAQAVANRLLDFQERTGYSWQQAGEAGFNRVAAAVGRTSFQKPMAIPKISLVV